MTVVKRRGIYTARGLPQGWGSCQNARMAFRGVDYYAIEDDLTEDERLVRDNVRKFVEAKVVPVISKHYQEGSFPMGLIPQFAELGLLGANLHGYGCAGM